MVAISSVNKLHLTKRISDGRGYTIFNFKEVVNSRGCYELDLVNLSFIPNSTFKIKKNTNLVYV